MTGIVDESYYNSNDMKNNFLSGNNRFYLL